MKIERSTGLQISEEILKLVKRKMKGFKAKGYGSVYVGAFTNCREVGLTYLCANEAGDTFTFCTYEHRNIDQIIVNGKQGYISRNGDLPYCSDSKWGYLGCFSWKDYEGAAEFLSNEIKKFLK